MVFEARAGVVFSVQGSSMSFFREEVPDLIFIEVFGTEKCFERSFKSAAFASPS